jgi:hypothetical protein
MRLVKSNTARRHIESTSANEYHHRQQSSIQSLQLKGRVNFSSLKANTIICSIHPGNEMNTQQGYHISPCFINQTTLYVPIHSGMTALQ